MNEFLAKFDGPHFIGLVAVAGGLLCGILCGVTGILAGCWEKVRRADILAALKQDMLNRGMTAEEIWTVIEAGSRASRKALQARFACTNPPSGV